MQRLVLAWQYDPTLRAYREMDMIGMKLKKEFPHWERGPLHLELRELTTHRRLAIAHDRCFFETLRPKNRAENLALAVKCLNDCRVAIDIPKARKLGLRRCFTASVSIGFEELVKLLFSQFYQPVGFHLTISDHAFVVDFKSDGWTYAARVGPMERKQWFQYTQVPPTIFEQREDGATVARFRSSLPQTFIYVDIDASANDASIVDPHDKLTEVDSSIRRLATDLLKHCEGDS